MIIAVPLVIAFVVGLLPFVPEGAKQITWLVALVLTAGAALWDMRRRAAAKARRKAEHEERQRARGARPPRRAD